MTLQPILPLDAAATGPDLSIVVPVYRSQDCLEALIQAISRELSPVGLSYEVVLVNDCSPDQSWAAIEALCQAHPNVIGVDLRRNFGQDNAILTGLRFARGGVVAIMDDDLQHHPRYLPVLLAKLAEGHDIVYADFRVKCHKLWKRLGSWFNGKVAEWLLNKPRALYLSPYKVLRQEISELICDYDGPDPYIDELIFRVTSRVAQVPVEHQPRLAGVSTYTLWKSIQVWARLVFSSSIQPLRMVTAAGALTATLGALAGVAAFALAAQVSENSRPALLAWGALTATLLTLGGVQMVFFGILGEYVGRTYRAVRGTPQAVIRQTRNADRGRVARTVGARPKGRTAG
jgi:undecaprenyl-phosphate 4-deoxy-4-formamido-L-arabinose transferase